MTAAMTSDHGVTVAAYVGVQPGPQNIMWGTSHCVRMLTDIGEEQQVDIDWMSLSLTFDDEIEGMLVMSVSTVSRGASNS